MYEEKCPNLQIDAQLLQDGWSMRRPWPVGQRPTENFWCLKVF